MAGAFFVYNRRIDGEASPCMVGRNRECGNRAHNRRHS